MAKFDFISTRFLKKNKKRSISILSTIIISVALITGILNYGLLYRELNLQEMYKKTGEYHGIAKDISQEKINKIQSNFQVEKTGEFKIFDILENNSTYLRKIRLTWMDKKALEINKITVINGKMPDNKNEILMEKWMAEYLNKKPGDEIDFNNYSLFTVSGIIENITGSRLRGEGLVITKNKEFIKSNRDLLIKINSNNIEKDLNTLMKNYDIKDYSVNYSLLQYLSERDLFSYPVLLLIILLFLVSTSSIMSIYNMSIVERIKEIGMIRAIGGTKIQIKKILYKENFILIFLGLPFGLFLGHILPYFFGMIFKINITSFIINPYVIFSVVLMGIISALISSRKSIKTALSLSPMEAIKKEPNDEKQRIVNENLMSKIFYKIFGVKGKIAYKNLKRNGKKSTATIFTMALMVTLFITFSFVIKSMNSSFVASQYVKGDFEIRDESRVQNAGFSKSQVEELSYFKNIKDIKLMKKTIVKFPYNEKDIPEFYKTMAKKITENGKTYYTLNSDIYGYSKKMIKEMESFLVSGEIDLSIMSLGNYVLIPKSYSEQNNVSVNDEIWVYNDDEKIKFIVAGIYNKIPYTFSYHNIGERLIISNNTFSENFKDDKYKKIVVETKEDIDKSEMILALSEFASKVSGGQVISFQEEVENLNNQVRIVSFIGNSVIISILILSIFSLSNTINTNILLRTRELGSMRALGLDKKGLKTLISIEGLSFGLIASFWGIIFGSIFGVAWFALMRITQDAFLIFKVPYLYLILTPIVVIFLGYLITLISIQTINKKPIIEMVKNNE
ncbi:MAG: ABC transporter permease [Thermotogota bacterium]